MRRLTMWVGALLLSALPIVFGQEAKISEESITLLYRWPDSLKNLQIGVSCILEKGNLIFVGTFSEYLWVTPDTGKTWTQRGRESGLRIPFGDVVSLAALPSGRILLGALDGVWASDDNGIAWRRIKKGAGPFLLVTRSGKVYAGGVGILLSSDGGDTWVEVADSTIAPSVYSLVELSSGTILAGNGSPWSLQAKGVIRSTPDGGWQPSNAGLKNKNIFGLSASSEVGAKTVFAVTYDGGAFRSDDEGRTWRPIADITEYFGGAVAVYPGLGVFLGFVTVSTEPLYQSTDNGISWYQILGLKGSMIVSLARYGNRVLLIGAHDGFWVAIFSPIIATPVETEPTVPSEFALRQNYPNPFNPSTTIEFSLPERSFVKLTILNLLGQEITTLVAGEKEAGVHRFTWNSFGLPSGIYLYRLETRQFVSARRMLLVK